jgi:hypothetical protein
VGVLGILDGLDSEQAPSSNIAGMRSVEISFCIFPDYTALGEDNEGIGKFIA